jgi:hypothetical protein
MVWHHTKLKSICFWEKVGTNFGSLNNPSNLHFICVSSKNIDKQLCVSISTHVICKKTIKTDVVFHEIFQWLKWDNIWTSKIQILYWQNFNAHHFWTHCLIFFLFKKKIIGTTSWHFLNSHVKYVYVIKAIL